VHTCRVVRRRRRRRAGIERIVQSIQEEPASYKRLETPSFRYIVRPVYKIVYFVLYNVSHMSFVAYDTGERRDCLVLIRSPVTDAFDRRFDALVVTRESAATSHTLACKSLFDTCVGRKINLQVVNRFQDEAIACAGCVMCLKYISLQAISMVSTVRQMKLSTARALGCFFS
jgi:Pyruvate/2-oxoacid:ferredoxin oxidoreductase delta subunit